jgi:hypothetical protein
MQVEASGAQALHKRAASPPGYRRCYSTARDVPRRSGIAVVDFSSVNVTVDCTFCTPGNLSKVLNMKFWYQSIEGAMIFIMMSISPKMA